MSNIGEIGDTYFFVNREDNVKCVKMSDTLYSVSGILCHFREGHSDFYGDFFLDTTDFGLQKTSPVFYQHLRDGLLKSVPLSNELGQLKTVDKGIWIDGQLNLAKDYAQMVANKYGISVEEYLEAAGSIVKMFEAGILGWSSGTSGHTMKSVKMTEGNNWLAQWHLGIDASLTPNPAEFKTIPQFQKALPLKSMVQMLESGYGQQINVKSHSEAQTSENPLLLPPPVEKSGRIISKQNLTNLEDIQTQFNTFVTDMKQKLGLTDNVEANATSETDMNGEELKALEELPKPSDECKACSARSQMSKDVKKKKGSMNPQSGEKSLNNTPTKWDVWSMLYDIRYTLEYAPLSLINVPAMTKLLRDAADTLEVVAENEANNTKSVEEIPAELLLTKTASGEVIPDAPAETQVSDAVTKTADTDESATPEGEVFDIKRMASSLIG